MNSEYKEINHPRDLYGIPDKYMKILKRKIVQMFLEFQPNLLNIDELEIMKRCKAFYKELNEMSLYYLLIIAQETYMRNGGKRKLDKSWLDKILKGFDPVTQYIYDYEIERKEQRCEESIIACMQIHMAFDEPLGRAMGLWARMITQYGDIVTDKAYHDALKERGVKKVRWITQKDHRVCQRCDELDGRVFLLKDVPPKQHWNCRCYYVAVSSRTHLK